MDEYSLKSNKTNETSWLTSITSEHNYILSQNETTLGLQNELSWNPKERLKTAIAILRERRLINKRILRILNINFSEATLELLFRDSGEENDDYLNVLKRFAISMYFYCPAAYEYLRQILPNMLPPINKIRKWQESSVSITGFTKKAFKILKEKVSSLPNSVYVSLVFDEISIKKCSEWDGKAFVGYVDLGEGVCLSDIEEARTVLVLMVVAVNAPWKIPIACYFINRLSADITANIVREAILRLQDLNINVLAVTCNGSSTNVVLGNKLGCNFMVEDLDNRFKIGEQSIQYMLDAYHMIDLVRSLFCDFKILKNQNGSVIDCKYIELLEDLQKSEYSMLANKMKRKRMHFDKEKAECDLALHIQSCSIGKALLCASTDLKLDLFEGAVATAEFCLLFDKLLAIFSSKNKMGTGFKAVLSGRNKLLLFSFLDDAESYLLGLKDKNDRPLYHTAWRIAIIGLLSLSRGIRSIYTDVVETNKLNYLSTHSFSVNNLELFFHKVRNRADSTIPTALEFKETYTELLTSEMCNETLEV